MTSSPERNLSIGQWIGLIVILGGAVTFLWSRFDRVDDELNSLRAEMSAEHDEISARIDARFDALTVRMDQLIDTRPQSLMAANLP